MINRRLILALMGASCFGVMIFWSVMWAHEPRPLPSRNPHQSWDQENLKRNDRGCPSSVYTVIDDELVQCPPIFGVPTK